MHECNETDLWILQNTTPSLRVGPVEVWHHSRRTVVRVLGEVCYAYTEHTKLDKILAQYMTIREAILCKK
jgi:hypothetical protein